MFKTEISYWQVYVTRDSYSNFVKVWDCNIGILKKKGCVEYRSASMLKDGRRLDGLIGEIWWRGAERMLGKTVPQNTAWHVNLRTDVWTRIDQTMYLWPEVGKPQVAGSNPAGSNGPAHRA